jgi:hypothetical protein
LRKWLLHNENAPAYQSLSVQQYLARTLLLHSLSTRPDPSHTDPYPFPRMETMLKRKRFQSAEESKIGYDEGTYGDCRKSSALALLSR